MGDGRAEVHPVTDQLLAPIAVAGMNHHNANAAALEAFRFPDEEAFLASAKERFRGVALLQTCNRVEVIVNGDAAELTNFLQETGREEFTVFAGVDALRHLLDVGCGVDSMIIGEDQIIGQLRKALANAQAAGTSNNLIEFCITKAVHAGVEARRRTQINRGAVSIGSAAVQLAEEELGDLGGKHILVIGSGEMGMLVAQALAAKDLTAIYVANRTHARAVQLAAKIGGKAVHLEELTRYLILSDVVISCTSAPHPIIRCEDLKTAMKGRCWPLEGGPRPLILIDIAQPRDVEEGSGDIEGVRLFSIDSLREINEGNMKNRRSEAERAREFIEEELGHFIAHVNRKAADDVMAALRTWADSIRVRERDRALQRLGNPDERSAGVIDDLSRALVNKLLADVSLSIRSTAERGDLEGADALVNAIIRGERICFQQRE